MGSFGEDFVYQQRRTLGHPAGTAARAKAASFTAEGDQTLVMTILAANPHETILQTATLEEVVEFLLDVARQVLTLGFE